MLWPQVLPGSNLCLSLLSPFCCSWAPNDDVTAILPVVFSYHTLESLYVICHVTVCPSKLVKISMYGFRTSFRTFDSLGCDLENVECLKRDVYYCNIYMYTCIFCVYLFITHVVTVYL